jgi:hypothetical protein
MRKTASQTPPTKKRTMSEAVDPRAKAKTGFTLAAPPTEIADDGEVQMGCVTIAGRFPAYRQP